MKNYKGDSKAQSKMIVVDYVEQIKPGTFEFALDYLIDNEIDLSGFDDLYKNDDTGAPAYSPRVMLKIILYAYSLGIVSSREIDAQCKTVTTFMALSADSHPHYTTIANFVTSMKDQITDVFKRVIILCHQQGLIGKQMFAIDGCKISSNCSKEWSGNKKQFMRKKKRIEQSINYLLEKHRKNDKSEPTEWGQKTREKKAIQSMKKTLNKISKWLDENKDKRGSRNKIIKSNMTDNESANMPTSKGMIQGYTGVAAVDSKHQVIVSAEAHGENQEKHLLEPTLDDIKETFEDNGLDKNVLKKAKVIADTGFHTNRNIERLEEEGNDGYIADNNFRQRDVRFKDAGEHKKRTGKTIGRHVAKYYKAHEFTPTKWKRSLICPAGKELPVYQKKHRNNTGLIGKMYRANPEDCISCELRSKCVQGNGKGPRSVSIYTHRDPNVPDSPTQRMIKKIDSSIGRYIYSRRMGIVEPVFGNICNNLGLNYFYHRGKTKVNIQWKLYCLVHNLKKLFRYGESYALQG
jgi:transposase